MKILVIIPARGGSKGIPKKNIRLMNGKPLITYAINTAMNCKNEEWNLDVVVSTDDEEINLISKNAGVHTVIRPAELCEDSVTLDPVIYHAIIKCENEKKYKYDYVITMQPTSPTLKAYTVIEAIKKIIISDVDTLISVVEDKHLAWRKENNVLCPAYEKRVNRQMLPEYYREVGAFVISKRSVVTKESRFGKNIDVCIVPENEGIDIDTENDWVVCEAILKRKKIYLRANGEETLGMGHIYRVISLAHNLMGNDITFLTNPKYLLGYKRLLESNYKVIMVEDDYDVINVVKAEQPDIFINDCLDTCADYVQEIKKYVNKFVSFEDKGSGIEYADVVINALYENYGSRQFDNVYSGFEYFFIRNEFLEANKKQFSEEVRNIVFLFGGSDPSNMTMECYNICRELSAKYERCEFHIITGMGYKYKYDLDNRIYIHNDVKRVSSFLEKADMAVTSQGRTIYELACMGVPAIVLAHNKREAEHVFAGIQNGFINLGLGNEVETGMIKNTIEWLINTPNVRRDMRNVQLMKDFSEGQKNVKNLILED